MKKINYLLIPLLVFCTSSVFAAAPEFDNLSASEVDGIIEEFGANFNHTSVSPANSLGKIFGFEIGIIAGATKSETIEKLSKEVDPNSEVSVLPHAGILGAVSFPFGIKGEVIFLPDIDQEDAELGLLSLAAQWTVTDMFFELPVELAVKAHHTMASFSYVQDISGTPANVEFEQKMMGLMVLVSKSFVIFTPYAGIGLVKADGDISISGSNDFFDFTNSQSYSSDSTGMSFMAGFNANLLIFKLGLEVGKVFDSTKATMKISAGF